MIASCCQSARFHRGDHRRDRWCGYAGCACTGGTNQVQGFAFTAEMERLVAEGRQHPTTKKTAAVREMRQL